MNKVQSNENRVLFADYIRVVACFLVMLVHASENFYGADSSGLAGNVSCLANEANRFWVSFYDGGLGRISVPLFMMVSAFLLVPMKPGMSMAEFYKKRLLRILPPMIFFMLLYTFLPLLWGGMTWEQSMADLKLLPWNFPSMAGHLWFMYPLISIYLIIPVVSPWIEKAKAGEERLFLGIFFLSCFLPWIHRFVYAEVWGECFWNGFSMLWYCSGYLGFLVMAHYIRVHLNWSREKKLAIGSLCLVGGAAFTAWSFWWKGVPGVNIETPMLEWAWEFCTPNVAVATFGAFVLFSLIKPVSKENMGWGTRMVISISKLSFGMYLMHMFFLSNIASYMVNGNQAEPLLPVWLAIPVIAIASYACCLVTTKLMALLPGSKWTVGA